MCKPVDRVSFLLSASYFEGEFPSEVRAQLLLAIVNALTAETPGYQ
jgi:hypothetical protein